jgi:tripartite-type tricarboxylate transporter receptor subunit TctC
VASPRRSPIEPGVQTTREGGFPYLLAENWLGVSGPGGLPEAVVERLNAEVMAALRAPVVRARLEEHAIVPQPLGPAEFTAFVTRDVNEIGGMIRQLRITLQ